jgi:cysteinyl-tRNA synthetase
MLQSQYRSTLDFSNEALKAAQKGYKRIANGLRIIKGMEFEADNSQAIDAEQIAEIDAAIQGCYDGMNDDLNTAVTISHLFTLLKKINQLHTGQLTFAQLGQDVFDRMKTNYINFLEQVLGLREEFPANQEALINGMLALYASFKEKREYDKVDEIRASFKAMGLLVKDMKTRIDWAYEE